MIIYTAGQKILKVWTKKTRKIKNNEFRETDSFHFFIMLLCMIYKDIIISLRHCIILVTVAWPWQPTGYLIIRN